MVFDVYILDGMPLGCIALQVVMVLFIWWPFSLNINT